MLWTKGSEQALKATFGCLKPRGHVVSVRKNWSWWRLKVKVAFFIRNCSRALVPAQYTNNHLFRTVFLSSLLFGIILSQQPLFLVGWLEKTKTHLALSPTGPASLLPPGVRPPLPSLLILWIYLLMASLLTVPPISGISSPVRVDRCQSVLRPH